MAGSNDMTLWVGVNPTAGSALPSTAAGDYYEIPFARENLKPATSSTKSALIRKDRQPADEVRTGMQVAGTLNGEVMHGAYTPLLEAALFSADLAAVAADVAAMTLTIVSGTGSVTAASGTPFANLVVGDYFRMVNASGANHGKTCRIVTKASDTAVTVDSVELTDETSVAGYTINPGDHAVAGKQRRDVTVVKEFTDEAKYEVQLGHLLDGLTLGVRPNGIAEIGFNFRGRSVVPDFSGTFVLRDSDAAYVATGASAGSGETAFSFPTILGGAVNTAPANPVMSTIRNATIYIDGVPSTIVTELSLTVANNVYGSQVVGVEGDRSIKPGSLAVTGSVGVLLEGAAQFALYQDAINDGAAAVSIKYSDADGRTYILHLGRAKLKPQGTENRGENQDIPLTLDFSAVIDATTNRTLRLHSWPAL